MARYVAANLGLVKSSLDEAIALPTDFSARIARNTQLYLQLESGTTKVIDPWGGSYYVERLTHDLALKALEHIKEVEELGGMTKAIEAGLPKLRIEEAAARTQARIDSGQQTIVGINRYPLDEPEDIDVLKVDNSAVRAEQLAKAIKLGIGGRDLPLNSRPMRSAGFSVLKSPDIPSILVETGFISNPGEARKLATRSYQQKMARQIHAGIRDYFVLHPPPGTLLAWQKQQGGQQYVIARGDTLSGIAQRFNVSVNDLKLHNGLDGTRILVGQTLKTPTT